jgi:short-subunit dehydrogenase
VIAAEDVGIEQAAVRLRRAGGPTVDAVRTNLATADGVEQLYRRIERTARPVAAIAINAGRGAGGDFARKTDVGDEQRSST